MKIKKPILLLLCLLGTFIVMNAQYNTVLDFDNGQKGSNPHGSVISDGTYLYGMTTTGGTNNNGVIFKTKTDGTDYSVLLNFNSTANGRGPWGTLLLLGNTLFGIAAGGGINDMGALFKIKTDGSGYVKILDFAGVSNGSTPIGSLTFDGTYLYGVTAYGGSVNMGTLYKIKPNGTGYKLLIDFTGTLNGANPYETVISDGTYLYGMCSYGGTNNSGTMYKINADGTGFQKLLDFDGANKGGVPRGFLTPDSNSLYGMTVNGGLNNMGTIFKILKDGTGYVRLLDFAGASNGSYPNGSLVRDGQNLYGVTAYGGTSDYGALFTIKTDGSAFKKLVDFSFTIGSRPFGNILNDGAFLYGLANSGGAYNYGVLFKYLYPTASIQSTVNINNFQIYPNPAHGKFNIILEQYANATIKITDQYGKEIFSSEFGDAPKFELDLTGICKGIYFVRITDTNKKTQIKKIIIN